MTTDCTPNGGRFKKLCRASWDVDSCWSQSVYQGAGSCCKRLSAAAAMVLRLSTVESNSGTMSSSSPGKSSSWSSGLLFKYLLQINNEKHLKWCDHSNRNCKILGKHAKILLKVPVKLEKGGDKTENRILVFTAHRLFVMISRVPSK